MHIVQAEQTIVVHDCRCIRSSRLSFYHVDRWPVAYRRMPFTPEQKRLFDKYYAKAQGMADQSRLVSLIYLMIDTLSQANLSYPIETQPLHMGIHPQNRGGKKMQALQCRKKAIKYGPLDLS